MVFSQEELDRLIGEDVPYFDLTTHLLGIGAKQGEIRYFTREDCVLAGMEAVRGIFARLGIEILQAADSGTAISAGTEFFTGRGSAESLHTAWKVCQNILDRCSGIAAKTARLCAAVQKVNPNTEVLVTRKSFPGTKKLFISAVLAGGGLPHRLGLSETVLVFAQHWSFLGGAEAFCAALPEIRHRACEKKVLAEADSPEQALQFLRAGADGIQFDKLDAKTVATAVRALRAVNPQAVVLAAGGIDEHNAADYAAAGVNGIVVTCLANAKPVDMGVKITAL